MSKNDELREIQKAIEEQPVNNDHNLSYKSASGFDIKNLYTPIDLIDFNYLKDIGLPGKYPFVRGKNINMYRDNPWIIAQYQGFGSAEETNQRYKYLLDRGQASLQIAVDLPSQMGYDSDHPLAKDEVGKVGVPICSLRDMEILFDGIELQKMKSFGTSASAIGPIIAAFIICLAEKRKVNPNNFLIRINNDILNEYIARGTFIFPPEPSLSLSCDLVEYCSNHLPKWIVLTMCGYHIRESGATAVQELAFALSKSTAYLDELTKRNLQISKFADNLEMMLSAGMDFFEEIAKFRAARKVWAKLIMERYNAPDPHSQALSMRVYTAGSALTAQEPFNNIIRVTLEAFAAVCGGTQLLFTSSMDEALSVPAERAVKIALRTQQIIAEETGINATVDPLGGSYYVEWLTKQIENTVDDYMKKIEDIGGPIRAIEEGYFQYEIGKSAIELQKEIGKCERTVVGVNKYHAEDAQEIELLKFDPKGRERQIMRLKELRKQRSNFSVEKALNHLEETAENNQNLMPSLIEVVKSYGTVGEICERLKKVYGSYKESHR